jgi:anti-sigma factor RsiW
MTAHREKIPLINALIDNELDVASIVSIEQHIMTCPECAEIFDELKRVREIVGRSELKYAAPEPFRRRLRIALDQDAAARRPRAAARARRVPLSWIPSSALATFGVVACLFASVQYVQRPLGEELVSDHLRSLLADHLMDVPTSDRHVVKPWFDGKVPFAPTVIDFKADGFPLVGGRLDVVGSQRVAGLVYRRRLHVINVFVWSSSDLDRLAQDRSVSGYNLVHWMNGGLNYWAVSDLDLTEMRQFRDLYVRSLKH